jgi:DNA adenine methylase
LRRTRKSLKALSYCRPFVKWAGGKTQLVDRLTFPKDFEKYYEPFLGGGAVFFHLAACRTKDFRACLTDSNPDLVGAYATVRDSPDSLIDALVRIQNQWRRLPISKKGDHYYRTRDSPPDPRDRIARAAWFIFLNKTAYNGLYRVNRKGKFNVPYGDYPNATLCEPENLRNISSLLNRKGIELAVKDYAEALSCCSKDDFVYLDPPYQPVTKSGFRDYTKQSFGEKDQRMLSDVFHELCDKGCKVLLSNSDSALVRQLYADSKYELTTDRLRALRMINSVGSRRTGAVELAIRNYN